MLLACIGQRVFCQIEGLACGVDEGRARHVLAAPVVVADSAEEYGTRIQTVDGFDMDISLQRVRRLVVVDKAAIAFCQRCFCLYNVLRGKARQGCIVTPRQPCVLLLHKLVVAQ